MPAPPTSPVPSPAPRLAAPPDPAIPLPRALIFLGFVWLIASWLLAIGVVPPVHPSSASYRYGVQIMMICLMSGLTLAWPLVRLSQPASPAAIRQTVLDLIVLIGMLQIVLWPLRLITTWTLERTAAIDATCSAWTILTGAVVASAVGAARRGPRALAMIGCVSIALLAPLIAWTTGGAPTLALNELSPLVSSYVLAGAGAAQVPDHQWQRVFVLALAGVVAWTGLATWALLRERAGRA